VRVLVRGMNKKEGAFDADTYLEDYIKCVVDVWLCVGVYRAFRVRGVVTDRDRWRSIKRPGGSMV
jgi:hypothetical protein